MEYTWLGNVAEYSGEGPMTIPTLSFQEEMSTVNKPNCDDLGEQDHTDSWRWWLFGSENTPAPLSATRVKLLSQKGKEKRKDTQKASIMMFKKMSANLSKC